MPLDKKNFNKNFLFVLSILFLIIFFLSFQILEYKKQNNKKEKIIAQLKEEILVSDNQIPISNEKIFIPDNIKETIQQNIEEDIEKNIEEDIEKNIEEDIEKNIEEDIEKPKSEKDDSEKQENDNDENKYRYHNLPNDIFLIYDIAYPDIIKIISQDNKQLEYNYKTGKIHKLIDCYGNIREYDQQTYNLVKEIFFHKKPDPVNFNENDRIPIMHQKKYDSYTGHLFEEITPDQISKEYIHYLKKEIFPNGTTREYFPHHFRDTSEDQKIIKEYDINSRNLIKLIFNNGYIKEYGLYTNKLTKEIFPDGEVHIYNPFTDKIITKIKPDGKIEEYDPQNGFLLKEIFTDGKIIETIREYNDDNNKLKRLLLSNKNIIEFEEESNEIKQIIYPDGTIKESLKEYNSENNKLSQWTSPDGDHIKYFDNIKGNLIKEKLPDGKIKEYDPDTCLLTKEIFENNFYIIYEYIPETNDISQVTFSDGTVVKYNFNFF
ncbi:DUF2963 domain-containing protein ['Camptotheca acuminata' phytoplasma]|uniref:DUF2963 domain-containing protein n=1 Tax='Camptotheca acuminata' phytoplasma TaxID=3239192 RepID=UPI00351A3C8D